MANDFLSGISGALGGLTDYLLYDRERKRQDEEDRQRREAHQALMELRTLEQLATRRALDRAPVEEAAEDLKRRLDVQGVEGALNDPSVLALSERAGIPFERKEPARPEYYMAGEDFGLGTVMGFDPKGKTRAERERHATVIPRVMSPEQQAELYNAEAGIFPRTGIVKPPQVEQAEAQRELAIGQARAVRDWLQRMGGPGASQGADTDNPQMRMLMRLGLGINANEVYGPIRETPEEAAAKAAATARARLPFQKELFEEVFGTRQTAEGDPYFNEVLRMINAFLPPIDEEGLQRNIEIARATAGAAQRVQPRGAAALRPGAGGPAPTAPPTPDAIIDDALAGLQTYERVIQELQRPDVQQRIKADGVDPAVVLRRAQARKISQQLQGGRPR